MRDENLSDGNSAMCLMSSGVPVLLTGTTLETILATILVPAGIIGPHTVFCLWHDWSAVNNANVKTVRTRVNGAAFGPAYAMASAAAGGFITRGANRGSVQSQVWWGSGFTLFGNTGVAMAPTTLDLSVDQPLTITGQLANAGDSMTLEWWMLNLYNVVRR